MTDGPKEPIRIPSAISDKTDQRGIAEDFRTSEAES